MTQVARNLTEADDGFLRGMDYLILDRDPLYTAAFRRLLRDSGVSLVDPLIGSAQLHTRPRSSGSICRVACNQERTSQQAQTFWCQRR